MQEEGIAFDSAVPRVSREVVFTTHTPVPAGHDRFDADVIEEHLGPLRRQNGAVAGYLMGLGREKPSNQQETFCMTVLGLRLSRRANASVGAATEKYRAGCGRGFVRASRRTKCRSGTSPMEFTYPSCCPPQMFRLYDRHLGNELARAQ